MKGNYYTLEDNCEKLIADIDIDSMYECWHVIYSEAG